MNRLGIDFDNTLIDYDEVFYKVALQKKLIPKNIKPTKFSVRDYLVKKDQEKNFTLLQGEVYGANILYSKQHVGMFETLKKLKKKGFKLFIVSHKTRYPYEGKPYDLHKSATDWLEKNKFFDSFSLGMNKSDVYFEQTKENKVKRIEELKLNFFIDDLEHILEMIDPNIKRILYNPNKIYKKSKNIEEIGSWKEILNLV